MLDCLMQHKLPHEWARAIAVQTRKGNEGNKAHLIIL